MLITYGLFLVYDYMMINADHLMHNLHVFVIRVDVIWKLIYGRKRNKDIQLTLHIIYILEEPKPSPHPSRTVQA